MKELSMIAKLLKIILKTLLFIVLLFIGISIAYELKVSLLYLINRMSFVPLLLFMAGVLLSFPLFSKFYNTKNYPVTNVVFVILLITALIINNILFSNLLCGVLLPLLLWNLTGIFSKINESKPINKLIFIEITGILFVFILTMVSMKMVDEKLLFGDLFITIFQKLNLWITI
ncbi:MAG: hypothetical protein PVJ20_12305 [Desulfobacterales bacterium]